jgi:hypothetical protein
MRKISTPPVFDFRTVQPVASRYTVYVTRPTPDIVRKYKYSGVNYPELIKNMMGPSMKYSIAALFVIESNFFACRCYAFYSIKSPCSKSY